MRLRRSKAEVPVRKDIQVKPPIPARINAFRGMVEHYRDSAQGLRPYWRWLIPFLLWQAHTAYHGEIKRQRQKLAKAARQASKRGA